MGRFLLFTGDTFKVINIDPDNLDDFYKHLGCDCFDIARRRIGDKYYDIFCDDEGLFKDNNPITAINSNCESMLVGNLIFANHDGHGNTIELSKEDVDNIIESAVMVSTKQGREFMCVMCEY